MIAPNMPPRAAKSKCVNCGYKHLNISMPSDALPNFASTLTTCPKCSGEMKEVSLSPIDMLKLMCLYMLK